MGNLSSSRPGDLDVSRDEREGLNPSITVSTFSDVSRTHIGPPSRYGSPVWLSRDFLDSIPVQPLFDP